MTLVTGAPAFRRACAIFDLDGTLCNHTHRLHHIRKQPKDWDAFHAACTGDVPNPAVHALYSALRGTRTAIVFCSGRPDTFREQTVGWLMKHHCGAYDFLIMRVGGDWRPDVEVKREMLDYIRTKLALDPVLAIDDRPSVIRMWREAGIPTAEIPSASWDGVEGERP